MTKRRRLPGLLEELDAVGTLAIVTLLLLAACWRPDPRASLPTGAPYLKGVVTASEGDQIRLEADSGVSSGSPKAALTLGPRTVLLWRTGDPAQRADLRLGSVVSAWVGGPIRESYPVQATADTLVIESTSKPTRSGA
jgi:hypothetical protein